MISSRPPLIRTPCFSLVHAVQRLVFTATPAPAVHAVELGEANASEKTEVSVVEHGGRQVKVVPSQT